MADEERSRRLFSFLLFFLIAPTNLRNNNIILSLKLFFAILNATSTKSPTLTSLPLFPPSRVYRVLCYIATGF